MILNMHRHQSRRQRAAPWKPSKYLKVQCCLALLILRIAIHKIACQAQIPGMSQARDMESSICAGILSYCYSLGWTTVAGDNLFSREATLTGLGCRDTYVVFWLIIQGLWCTSSKPTSMSLVPWKPKGMVVVAPADSCETFITLVVRTDRRSTARGRQFMHELSLRRSGMSDRVHVRTA